MSQHEIEKLASAGRDFQVLGGVTIDSHSFLELLRTVDTKKLIKSGLISADTISGDLFSLYKSGSSNSLFRKKDITNDLVGELWASRVIEKAMQVYLKHPDIKFDPTSINNDLLASFAKSSANPDSLKSIAETLRKIGVIFVIVPYVEGSSVDGVCTKLANGIPVIGMSLRFSRYDSFWFTLMHELAHISLHYALLDLPILDSLDDMHPAEKIERQANTLARNSLIGKAEWRSCTAKSNTDEYEVLKFSKRVGVHPIVVAGRIRFENNNYKLFSKLVHSIDVRTYFKDEI